MDAKIRRLLKSWKTPLEVTRGYFRVYIFEFIIKHDAKIQLHLESERYRPDTHLRGLVGAEMVPVRGLRPGLSCPPCPRAARWLRYLVCDRRSCWDRVSARQAGAWLAGALLFGAWFAGTWPAGAWLGSQEGGWASPNGV